MLRVLKIILKNVLRTAIFNFLMLSAKLLDPSWQEIIAQGGLHIGAGRAKRFIGINDNQVRSTIFYTSKMRSATTNLT